MRTRAAAASRKAAKTCAIPCRGAEASSTSTYSQRASQQSARVASARLARQSDVSWRPLRAGTMNESIPHRAGAPERYFSTANPVDATACSRSARFTFASS